MSNTLSLASLSGSAISVAAAAVFFLLGKTFLGVVFIALAIVLGIISGGSHG